MKQPELTKFIRQHISYKDWEFYVGDKNGAMYLQIRFDAPDNANPLEISRQHCRKWMLSEWMTPTEVVQTCWAAVERAEIHEASENFKYKGFDIFNTHIHVDALTDVCDAGSYEHRGEPPKPEVEAWVEPFAKRHIAEQFTLPNT
jgi:hypothetical protein